MSKRTAGSTSRTSIPPSPVHPLSAFITIVIDRLWSTFEITAISPIILLTFATCFVSVLLIQRFIEGDDWGTSVAKGVVMGIVAGVPYSVIGTFFGFVLLGWAGVHKIASRN